MSLAGAGRQAVLRLVQQVHQLVAGVYSSAGPPPPGQYRHSLVEDLKYRFRIKAAQKQQLSAAQQGITSLTKLSILDVRSIWIHTVISHCGLPSNKVFLSESIFQEMEGQLRQLMTTDEEGFVHFEDFLPIMVHLIRTEVTPEDEEEIAKALFEVWFPDKNEVTVEELQQKTLSVVKTILFFKKFIPK